MFAPLLGLEAVDRFVPRGLIDESTLRYLRTALSSLPEAAYCAAFECRLSPTDDQVDFLMCTRANDGGATALVSYLRSLVVGMARATELQGLLAFCTDWAEVSAALQQEVPFVWLEFDLPRESPASETLPFLFFCLQPTFLSDPWQRIGGGSPIASRAAQASVIKHGLELLTQKALKAEAVKCLNSCLAALPNGGTALHVAPLVSRGYNAVRLVLSLPEAQVSDYLQKIAWPGQLARLAEGLDICQDQAGFVGVQLDIGASVYPNLGLQIYFPPLSARWGQALAKLARAELCSALQHDSVLAWMGEQELILPGRKWPERMRRELELKLSLKAQGNWQAKAYLGFGFDFVI